MEPPPYAYVPVDEEYDEIALKNILREIYGRHRCPACGKPFFFLSSAWDCHPEATAYEIWKQFAHRGPAGATSLGDLARGGGFGGGTFGT